MARHSLQFTVFRLPSANTTDPAPTTNEDIQQFEAAIGRALPDEYHRFLLDPPFEKDSGSWECLGLDDVALLIRGHEWLRAKATGKSCLQPPDRYLYIGSDLSNSMYVMDLQSDTLAVHEASSGGTQEIRDSYDSFAEFLRKMARYDREAAEDDAREANAAPWPRRLILAGFILLCILYVVYKATRPL